MVTQGRRIGGKNHELLLRKTMWNLREKGYRVIDLDGRSPTYIGLKNNKIIAISDSCSLTKSKLHDIYYMFDDVIRTTPTKEKEYDRIIKLNKKSPDAIAAKDNKIYAIEILGVTQVKDKDHIRNRKNWAWSEKQHLYSMFDGLMIKVFFYNTGEIVITDTFNMGDTSYPPSVSPLELTEKECA